MQYKYQELKEEDQNLIGAVKKEIKSKFKSENEKTLICFHHQTATETIQDNEEVKTKGNIFNI